MRSSGSKPPSASPFCRCSSTVPLTVNITEVFRLHTDLFDTEVSRLIEDAGDPFQLGRIRYVRGLVESMEINGIEEPCVIISASGMCEYGRILHHLRNNCENERNTVLIIGFQAKYTLGRRIVERDREIKIFGIKHRLDAEVQVLNSLSAHAGRSELIDFAKRFNGHPNKILLVHGEKEAMESLQEGLRERGTAETFVMREREPFEL